MFCKISIIIIANILFLYSLYAIVESQTAQECNDNIYKNCPPEVKSITDQQFGRAISYTLDLYKNVKPNMTRCSNDTSKWKLRKNVKCLSDDELQLFIDCFKYTQKIKFLCYITDIHQQFWPAGHKTAEAIQFHILLILLLEQKMQEFNSSCVVHYWDFDVECTDPIQSKVWTMFGTCGVASDNFTVRDGPFANFTCDCNETEYLKREWENNTIFSWECPECRNMHLRASSLPVLLEVVKVLLNYTDVLVDRGPIQAILYLLLRVVQDCTYEPYAELISKIAMAGHFKTHNHVGGWSGQMSIPRAPCDIVFWLMHNFQAASVVSQWQLRPAPDCDYLYPASFDACIVFKNGTYNVTKADINSPFTYFYDYIIGNSFLIGVEPYCYLFDYQVAQINNYLDGINNIPIAIKRLGECLSETQKQLYFPLLSTCPNTVDGGLINIMYELLNILIPYSILKVDIIDCIVNQICLKNFKLFLGPFLIIDKIIDPVLYQLLKLLNIIIPNPLGNYRFYLANSTSMLPRNATPFDWMMPNVGDCNLATNGQCYKLPQPPRYNQTLNGQRYLYNTQYTAGLNLLAVSNACEDTCYNLYSVLNDNNCYCSPYVAQNLTANSAFNYTLKNCN